ncbi:MAG: hypothetical protein KF842_10380 [Caulobacter sp.]|nr:hypothetical protein [Caulobacter sp.]
MKPVFALAVAGLLLAGCATSAAKVQPISISPLLYANKSCDELALQFAQTDKDLQVQSLRQNKTRRADKVGVLLLGLPLSSMTGHGAEGEVAQLKGEKIAIEKAQAAKGCPSGDGT